MSAGSGSGDRRYGRIPGEPAGEVAFSFEVIVATGQEGAELRAAQARAIKELLEWLATRRRLKEPTT